MQAIPASIYLKASKSVKDEREKNKLFDRYTSVGHYIYDVAVQRFIIENDMKTHNENKNIKYYLAVLNSNYVFDGKYEEDEAIYDSVDGEDIISYIKS